MSALRVAEMFASFQGEGPSAGQHAAFIRMSGCGVGCSWCDEPQTWDWTRFSREQESQRIDVDEACAWATGTGAGLAVITGGEPLAQRWAVTALACALAAAGLRVEVEAVLAALPEVVIATGRPLRVYAADTYNSLTLAGPVSASVIIDITSTYEQKFKALAAHAATQPIENHFAPIADTLSRLWGAGVGVPRAEAFTHVPVLGRVPATARL